jgi:ribosomal-protein-alanine N-acetyltransferase
MTRFLDEAREAGKLLHLAIADADCDEYLGEILFFLRTPEAAEVDEGEIAYVVAPEARGRGVAGSAVRLLSEWAFAQLGVQRLHLSIHPDNAASLRVAGKAGYSYEGTLRSQKLIRGKRVDSTIWSLLPGEL